MRGGFSRGGLTRRGALALMTGAGAGAATIGLASQDASSIPAWSPLSDASVSLGDLAARAGIAFGASVSMEVFSDPAYRQLYLDHARVLTSDFALKFGPLRPDRGPPRFQQADALVDFATANNMPFRGHCLIWNESNPEWIKGFDGATMGRLLDTHIEETVGRYAGRIQSWDVVNEPIWPDHRAPGGLRKGPWYNALGSDYIARALRRAAAADPKARLVINEAFTERGDALGLAVRDGLLRLIDELQKHGAPLHAVGLEAHLQPQHPADDAGFARFLERLSARGLDIYLSELDVDDTAFPRDPAARDNAMASRVGDFLAHALSVPAVKVLECWQLSDRYSWYADPQLLRGRAAGDFPRPLPFDRDMNRKPMFEAIANALRARVRV